MDNVINGPVNYSSNGPKNYAINEGVKYVTKILVNEASNWKMN